MSSTAIERRTAAEQLAKRPVMDLVNQQKLTLVKDLIGGGKKIPDKFVALFLEVCARYDLAWEAKEAWCIDNNGSLIIMVGRDGLRKIATNNGLNVLGDVVRENDTYKQHREGREVVITHGVEGSIEQRGKIVGAYAEAFDVESKEQKGFFYAPMSEYRPKSEAKLKHSPWGSQESVMILAAAERQAIRQATPLGGLLSEGEMDLNIERAERGHSGEGVTLEFAFPDSQEGRELKLLVDRANEADATAFLPAKIAMDVGDGSDEAIAAFRAQVESWLSEHGLDTTVDLVDGEAEDVDDGEPEVEAEPVEEVEWDVAAYESLRHSEADLLVALDEADAEAAPQMQADLSEVERLLEQFRRVMPADYAPGA